LDFARIMVLTVNRSCFKYEFEQRFVVKFKEFLLAVIVRINFHRSNYCAKIAKVLISLSSSWHKLLQPCAHQRNPLSRGLSPLWKYHLDQFLKSKR